MPFIFKKLSIPDVQLIEPKVFLDGRGFFLETYKHSDFMQAGIPEHFTQDNYSRSEKRVLRGLHYQKHPHGQGKLVSCVKGSIFDVAVDIRKGSPTYGKWVSAELTEENNHLLFVPAGFAHGFQVLSDFAEVLYKCTTEYYPVADRGILWNDPDIAIHWPLADPLLSVKDTVHPLLKDADNNFTV
jgi:dTDP-4-dehydrorhamnose 3,5-epimerase